MTEVQRNPQSINPKVKQFLDEINEVHEEIYSRYQLELVPVLNITKSGITPTLAVKERLPEKKVVNKVVKKAKNARSKRR